MSFDISRKIIKNQLVEKVEEISGQNIFDCYQCGNCSSGCPVVDYMDISPNQVIRLAQLGAVDEVLGCKTIWICSACLQCSTRCPKGIDVAKTMEAFRVINLRNREGTLDPNEIKLEDLEELPPIAIVGAFRKKTG